MLETKRRIHFVGIGGIGMSGIAELLAGLGHQVTGSDAKRSDITERLTERFGVTVHEGHAAGHIGDAEVVVFSSAVRPANTELAEARRRGLPVVPRAEVLAELMRSRFGIAIAGAHGKTTTTAMVAVVLEQAGLDPTAVIGGRLSHFGSNARLGRSRYMVAEADESDRSFLLLGPSMAVITNIDQEHMESYGSAADLHQAFVEFANRTPATGAVIACADDSELASLLPRVKSPVVTYGLDAPADITGTNVEVGEFGGRCVVKAGSAILGELRLQVPGRYNLQNALAAVAVANRLGVEFSVAAGALAGFTGAERRFQRYGEINGVAVVDDYGHHPTEIVAVLSAARGFLARRLIVAFQPHRYTRTQQLLKEFGAAFRDADEVVLTDIYSAGENAIPGVTSDALAEAIRRGGTPVRLVPGIADLPDALAEMAKPGDAVMTLGAGSIGSVAPRLIEALRRKGRAH